MKCWKLLYCRRKRRSSLPAFLFIVLSFAIFFSFKFLNSSSLDDREGLSFYSETLHKHFVLIGREWRLKSTKTAEEDMNCSSVQSAVGKQFVATGWTKETYKAYISGKIVALKFVNPYGHQMKTCQAEGTLTFEQCYMNSASKLLLEIVRLKALEHPNIIKVIGYCIPENPVISVSNNNGHTVSIIAEYGEPVNVIQLLQMSWPARLQICLGLAKLLYHLSHSYLGTVALNDFRRQQFVLVKGELKLIDIDYIGMADPSCSTDKCCVPPPKPQVCVACIKGVCKGYNEKLNILNAGKHFIQHVLPYSIPGELVNLTNSVVTAYERSSWSALKILTETEKIAQLTKVLMKTVSL